MFEFFKRLYYFQLTFEGRLKGSFNVDELYFKTSCGERSSTFNLGF